MRNFRKSHTLAFSLLLFAGLFGACTPEKTPEPPAESAAQQVPQDIVQNPVLSGLTQIETSQMDPMCVNKLLEEDSLKSTITKEECVQGHEIYNYKRGYNKDGDYQVAYANERNFNQHIGYRSIGRLGESLIVELHWDWGGQTRFNSLKQFSENDNTIKITDNFMFGDRCRGGLDNVRIAQGKIYYGQNLTHFGLMNVLAETKADRNIAYEGVTDSIGDCVAEADYVDHEFLGLNFSEKKMDYIHNSRVSQEDNPIQYCYDEILLENVKHNNRFIKAEHVPAFIRDIQYTCIGTSRPISFPVTVFPDVSTATNTVLEQCADGLALACDLTRSNEEISDHQFSTIHRRCNAGEKTFCTLLDNLIAAEVRDH